MTTTWQVLLLLVAANPKVSVDKISANEYVVCYYDSNWWIRLVQNVNCDKKDVEINFLYPLGPWNSFTWPREKIFVGYHI